MIVLVTGPRVLEDTEAATAWGQAKVREGLQPDATIVFTGDACGADRYAREEALARGLHLRVYEKSGRILGTRESDRSTLVLLGRWDLELTEKEREALANPKKRPLVRNGRMVRRVAELAPRYRARVIALHAAWSLTHGTDQTVTLAEEAGLHVDNYDCPLEFGP